MISIFVREFSSVFLLAELSLEGAPCERGHEGEHNGVRQVNGERRATRRQADEDTRDEEVEHRGEEEKLDPHFVLNEGKFMT